MTAHWSDTSGAWSSGRAGTRRPAVHGTPAATAVRFGARSASRATWGSRSACVDVGGPLMEPNAESVIGASSFDQALIAFRHVLWFMRPTMDRHSCAGLRRQPHTRSPAITASSGPTLERATWPDSRPQPRRRGPLAGRRGRRAKSAVPERASRGPRRARVGAILGTSAPRPGAPPRGGRRLRPPRSRRPRPTPSRRGSAVRCRPKRSKAVSERMTVYWAERRKAERRKKAAK